MNCFTLLRALNDVIVCQNSILIKKGREDTLVVLGIVQVPCSLKKFSPELYYSHSERLRQ